MNIVEVEFEYNHTSDFFINDRFDLKINLTVIVDTDRGLQFGKVVRIINDKDSFNDVSLGRVKRISSKKDYLNYLDNAKLAEEAVVKCREMVDDSDLNMTILDGYYNFDRSQWIFRFVSDERVDFRNLARDLGATFRTRIELRQIGIRDKAREIGGIGPCGRLLCCSSFLRNFDSVTINMAKNQSVSLNPSKINGVCGRLLCCLKYENDIYSDIKKELPKIGTIIDTINGKGKLVSVNVIKNTGFVEFDNKDRIEVSFNDSEKQIIGLKRIYLSR